MQSPYKITSTFEEDAELQDPNLEKIFQKKFNLTVRDLTYLTMHSSVNLVARTNETANLLIHLFTYYKQGTLLIGPSGCGKTSLVTALASHMQQCPLARIRELRLVEISAAALISGTAYRGEFYKRINELFQFLEAERNIVLFIDEAHALAMTGDGKGGIDALNILKPFLLQRGVRVILATTPNEAHHLTADSAFLRRFYVMNLDFISIEDAKAAFRNHASFLSIFHGTVLDQKEIESLITEWLRHPSDLTHSLFNLDELLTHRKFLNWI